MPLYKDRQKEKHARFLALYNKVLRELWIKRIVEFPLVSWVIIETIFLILVECGIITRDLHTQQFNLVISLLMYVFFYTELKWRK
jgi:hypothetical protein